MAATLPEPEFLSLAGTWMACRWLVMGHVLDVNPAGWISGLEGYLLGMHDIAHEMRIICEESV